MNAQPEAAIGYLEWLKYRLLNHYYPRCTELETEHRNEWGIGYFLKNGPLVHSGVLFILFCTVNWLDVESLNIEVGGGLTSEVGLSPPCTPHFNHCLSPSALAHLNLVNTTAVVNSTGAVGERR